MIEPDEPVRIPPHPGRKRGKSNGETVSIME
jgi:hypothetical protein